MSKRYQQFGNGQSKLSGKQHTEGTYAIMLINCTDYVVQRMRLNSTNENDPWTPTQAIGRTCNSDPNTCYNQQAWRELCYVTPGTTFTIQLGYQKNGQWWEATYAPYYADPNYAGGVIALTN